MRKRDLDRLVRKLVRHLQSPEGRASLKEARRQADDLIKELRLKRKVDPMTLFERVTI